jgi:hypothetical protein
MVHSHRMQLESFRADHQQRSAAQLLAASAAILCVIQIAVLVPNHDIAWLMEVSQRMLSGGKYYADFYEVNPPLYSIMLLPVALLSRVTAIAPYTILIVCVSGLLYYVSLQLLSCLSVITPEIGFTGRISLAVCMQADLFLLPGYDFGQRDHLAMCLILPLLCWFGTHQSMIRATPGAVVASICAALAVLIKPFLVVAVILPVAVRLVAVRRAGDLLVPVLLPAVAVTISYALLILKIFPEWIVMAHVARDSYYMYDIHAYLPKWSVVALLLIAVLAAANEYLQSSPAARLAVRYFAAGAAGALASYLIQRKGFSYHLVPTKIMLGLLLAITAVAVLQRLRSVTGERIYLQRALLTGLVMVLIALGEDIRSLSMPRELDNFYARFASKLTDVHAGDRLFFFSTSLPPQFPLNLYYHFTPSSRFPCLWTLPAAIAHEGADGPQVHGVTDASGELIKLVAEDFRRWAPTAFIVDESPHKQAIEGRFEFLPWFRRDPDMRRILDQYEFVARFHPDLRHGDPDEGFAIYVRRELRAASVSAASATGG